MDTDEAVSKDRHRLISPIATWLRSSTALVFFAAFLAKIPALNSWWCLDDWGQLARAAGLAKSEYLIPARWLSQYFYWTATWPLFGMEAAPYALTRILLHSFSAALVTRISKNLGLGSIPSLVAGLVFAASPISFTALYWGSGIQELLGGTFALLAIDRWMADSRKSALWATMFGVCSILSKECGLGLPSVLMATLIWNERYRKSRGSLKWALVFVLFVTGILESVLVWRNFPTGLDDTYRIGGFLVVLGNLGKFGWWMLTQGPVFTGQVSWTLAGIGLGFFTIWATWAFVLFRRGNRALLALFVAAMVSLAPVLVLVHQARPYMGYLAMACLSISIGFILPKRWKFEPLVKIALVVAAIIWGYWGMAHRVGVLSDDGLPADPIVRAMENSRIWSRYISNSLSQSEFGETADIVVLQQPLRAEDINRATRLGGDFVLETTQRRVLGGGSGLALIAGKGHKGYWANSLLEVPEDAYVFRETSSGFKAWGPTWDALIYASLLDVLVGNFQRAQDQLRLAAQIDNRVHLFNYDPDNLPLPMSVFRKQSGLFMDDFLVTNSNDPARKNASTPDYEFFLGILEQVRESD